MNSKQEDLFKGQGASGFPRITLELRGITVEFERDGKRFLLSGIPSFKTGKRAFAWRDRVTGKLMARPITLPEHSKWMQLAILSIESQLRSAFGITDEKIRTVACPQSWIASLVPLDDSWTWVRELKVESRLCQPGEKEGATIQIERLA